ncbi:GNAT family N-acetyltransferase [Streptomyces sp. NPDC058695]|uniref:GNAT family N-acetyltransferase n=1 Tax=Streptomyces sp. NPDC058695 TaxID=3346604 RepID=UPI003655838B
MRATGAPASSTRRIWSEPCDQVRDSRPGFGLVAAGEHGTVTGIIDVTVEVELATIDTVAVHPDHQNQGLGRALLAGVGACASALGVPILDAWARDEPDALRWYRAMGFIASRHYVH